MNTNTHTWSHAGVAFSIVARILLVLAILLLVALQTRSAVIPAS